MRYNTHMSTLRHLHAHIQTYGTGQRPLFAVSAMIFFFVLFDGIITYLAPIALVGGGLSESMMGIIIGSSSLAGIFFDLVICRLFPNTNYRYVFLLMFVLAAILPLVMFGHHNIWLFLIAMAIWGFYYDLYNLGSMDFVGRATAPASHSSSFGVLRVFDGLGYLIAPIVASLVLVSTTPEEYAGSTLWLILGLAFMCYLGAISLKQHSFVETTKRPMLGVLSEMHLWRKIGHILYPVLLLTFVLNIIDSTFWTIGPLFSELIGINSGMLGGTFMVAYGIPPLLIGWFVGRVTGKMGKKRTAHIALLFGSSALLFIGTIHTPVLLISVCFLGSFFLSATWPSVNGAYADYVQESHAYEKEIVTLQDAITNLGNIVGPILAGFSAEYLGYAQTFLILGIFGFISALVLIVITPREIRVYINK